MLHISKNQNTRNRGENPPTSWPIGRHFIDQSTIQEVDLRSESVKWSLTSTDTRGSRGLWDLRREMNRLEKEKEELLSKNQ